MKHLLLCIMLFAFLRSHSQLAYFADFGIPASQDYTLTTCSFDKNAEAIYLKKEARVFPDDYKMISVHRVRMKILKESGIKHADIRIPFYHEDGFEYISDISAVVINGKGSTLKKATLSPKDIYRKKATEYHSYVIFTLPEVHAGSIIEYSYTSTRKSYRSIDYWYFQEDLPVVESNFHFVVLPNAEFNYRVLKNDNFQCNVKNDAQEGSVSFAMKNMPGIPEEVYMDSRKDYLQRVELQLAMVNSRGFRDKFVSSWQEAVKELSDAEEFGKAIRNFSAADDEIKIAKLIANPVERMAYIYGTVKARMNWNGYVGLYASDRLKKIWESKKGTAQDINLILTSMLKSADLNAAPMLVSEREHGKIDVNQPYLNQFNKVIACVDINGKFYFLDATDEFNNVKLVPESLLNTQGFLVDRKNAAFITIGDDQHTEKKVLSVDGKLKADGLLHGTASVIEYDYSRAHSKAKITHDKAGFVNTSYIKPYKDNDIAIDSFYVENMDNDSVALNQKLDFRLLLKPNGEYLLINLNLFSGMMQNPFIADQRYTDINFGSKKSYAIYLNYNLDEGLAAESLPQNITLITADKSIKFQRMLELAADGKRVSGLIKLDLLKPTYEVGEYTTVKDFYKKMFSMLEEPLLIRIKK